MTKFQIAKKYGVKFRDNFPREIIDVISAGCELGYLTQADVEYMVSDECNLIRAVNLLKQRRKDQPDK